MPLFSNKFSPKKPIPRKANLSLISKVLGSEKLLQELGVEVGPIKLKLGDQESVFQDGQWVPETGPVSTTHRENQKLRYYIQQLEEENNLLKLKYEILLDMITQATAESHLQDKKIQQLQKQIQYPTRRK
ncbi:hypothetical protein L9F63_005059 [Diploptera punctata]|uniref:Chibby n=1 Tax=Diploptera punctata TaxID=6984 RepID=A0AAD8E6S6_DIPPU|nr:hypothetical protein L9F63_005059 [Diploptera punctata]